MIFFRILNAILQSYDNLMLKKYVVKLNFHLRGSRTFLFFWQAVTWLDVDAIRARHHFAVYAFRAVTYVFRACQFHKIVRNNIFIVGICVLFERGISGQGFWASSAKKNFFQNFPVRRLEHDIDAIFHTSQKLGYRGVNN